MMMAMDAFNVCFCSTLCVILDTLFKHLRYEDAGTEGERDRYKAKKGNAVARYGKETALNGKHAEKIIELNGTFSEICIGFLFLLSFFLLFNSWFCLSSIFFLFFSHAPPYSSCHQALSLSRCLFRTFISKLLERTYLSCCNPI